MDYPINYKSWPKDYWINWLTGGGWKLPTPSGKGLFGKEHCAKCKIPRGESSPKCDYKKFHQK